jgi:hypothetical protein
MLILKIRVDASILLPMLIWTRTREGGNQRHTRRQPKFGCLSIINNFAPATSQTKVALQRWIKTEKYPDKDSPMNSNV